MYRVVIIDDEPWTREVLKQFGEWGALGLDVAGEASDGDLGLQLIRRLHPEIVITDVRMPYLSGIDLVTKMRSESNDAQVIFVSGYDDFSFIRSALKLNATDYLLKPIRQDELNMQLKRCVERLDASTRKGGDSFGAVKGFLDASYVQEFYTLREQLVCALNAGDPLLTDRKLSEIETQIDRQDAGMPSADTLIQLYYTLTETLQRYIVESGYTAESVFQPCDPSFVFSRDTRLSDIISHEKRLYLLALEQVKTLTRERARLDVKKVLDYVNLQYARPVTLEETAARFFVSREYLSKVFKESAGEGFSEYVTRLRMERAQRLIAEYNTPIRDAAEAVGYRDQAHFYKVFKRHFGVTPARMRDASKSDKETRQE